MKQLSLREKPEIEFHAPKCVNESERVSIKRTSDQAIQMAKEQTTTIDTDMKTLFDAAAIIRKSITNCRQWKFTGSLKILPDETVPAELFSFYRQILQGPKHELSAGKKSKEVYNRTIALSQTTVSMCQKQEVQCCKILVENAAAVSHWDSCTPGREKQAAHTHATWIWNVCGLQQGPESRG